MKTVKASPQAAANCDRFEALTIGATFQIVARGSWRLIERYAKVGPDRVQSITDTRCWPFACCQASGSSVILVPDGAYSVAPYDCDFHRS
jgi:hypothetical protein